MLYVEFETITKRVGIQTDEIRNTILDFFAITFVDDANTQDEDILCCEAFADLPQLTAKKTVVSKAKRSQKYNSPIIHTSCTGCDEQSR